MYAHNISKRNILLKAYGRKIMKRKDVFTDYEIKIYKDGSTRIHSLGKFQSEPAYTPYFWEQFLDGMADEDTNGSLFFIITDADKTEFPELKDVYGIALLENNTGFVDSYRLNTQKDYNDAVKNCEDNNPKD
jgi:hypothetical protein